MQTFLKNECFILLSEVVNENIPSMVEMPFTDRLGTQLTIFLICENMQNCMDT